jgi:hypothetical protein
MVMYLNFGRKSDILASKNQNLYNERTLHTQIVYEASKGVMQLSIQGD